MGKTLCRIPMVSSCWRGTISLDNRRSHRVGSHRLVCSTKPTPMGKSLCRLHVVSSCWHGTISLDHRQSREWAVIVLSARQNLHQWGKVCVDYTWFLHANMALFHWFSQTNSRVGGHRVVRLTKPTSMGKSWCPLHVVSSFWYGTKSLVSQTMSRVGGYYLVRLRKPSPMGKSQWRSSMLQENHQLSTCELNASRSSPDVMRSLATNYMVAEHLIISCGKLGNL